MGLTALFAQYSIFCLKQHNDNEFSGILTAAAAMQKVCETFR